MIVTRTRPTVKSVADLMDIIKNHNMDLIVLSEDVKLKNLESALDGLVRVLGFQT